MLIKNNSNVLFILCFISLFGCSSQEKKENNPKQELLQQSQNTTQQDALKNQDTTNTQILTPHQEQFVKSFRKAEQTVSITDFEKLDNYNNTYLTKLSELTNLNHKQVCQIAAEFGLQELEKIVNALPTDSSQTKEAKRLTTLMRFNRLSLSKEAKEYLISKKNGSLSKEKQLESYLSVYEEAAKLHTDIDEKIELNKKMYPKSEKLANLTKISFEKFALIESQLGLLGLRSAILNIPNFPHKEKALEIISK